MPITSDRYVPSGPRDMEGEGIPEAHVKGIDMLRRAPDLPDSIKQRLPEPILPARPDWMALYWRTWAIVFDKVFEPPATSGFVSFMDEGFSNNIFQWDTCFMMSYLRYVTNHLPVHGTLDNFYSKQHRDGFICREINQLTGEDFWPKDHASNINPPLFSWSEVGFYRITADKKRIQTVLPKLVLYYEWLERNRRHKDGKGYWTTGLSSGMDNTSRAFDDGGIDAHLHYDHVWLCMTAQQALNAKMIAYLASEVEDQEITLAFTARYIELKNYVNKHLWNEEVGLYLDIGKSKQHVRVKTPASFWPLLAGITDHERASRSAQHIFDPREFWRPHALPSLSADHELYHPRGNYWQGGVWAPLVYMTLQGLHQCGLHKQAIKLLSNHLDNVHEVFDKTGTLWESYAPEEKSQGNISKPEFAGWTGNGPTAGLIETILGFEVNAPEAKVVWRLFRSDDHGIKRLPFGNTHVTFEYLSASETILADTEVPLKLVVEGDRYNCVISIPDGTSRHQLVV